MEKTIGAFEARRKFGQLIEEAHYQKDHFIIERSGRPMAVIVSVDFYERSKQIAKQQVLAMMKEVWERTKDVPEEELDADIELALAMLREENRAEQAASDARALP